MTGRNQQEDFDIQESGNPAPQTNTVAGEVESWEMDLAAFDIQEPGNPAPLTTSFAGEVENWNSTE